MWREDDEGRLRNPMGDAPVRRAVRSHEVSRTPRGFLWPVGDHQRWRAFLLSAVELTSGRGRPLRSALSHL